MSSEKHSRCNFKQLSPVLVNGEAQNHKERYGCIPHAVRFTGTVQKDRLIDFRLNVFAA